MSGRPPYRGAEECNRCGRRLSRRSAEGIGCPFCAKSARLAPDPLEPAPGETRCLVSETGLRTILPGHVGGSTRIVVHDSVECAYLSESAVETSVEAVERALEDRSLSLRSCGDCGGGLL